MRSKKKLPKLIYSKYEASILEVTSIDGKYLFIPVTPQQFKINKKRGFWSSSIFWLNWEAWLLPFSFKIKI